MTITVVVPVPHRALSPNSRSHWATLASKKAKAKADAFACALAAMRGLMAPAWPLATVSVRWFGKTRAVLKMDADNAVASLKASCDGCAEAGVLFNDHGLSWGLVAFAVDAKNPRVELTFAAAGEREHAS